jgi:hypothetical protein
MLTKSLQYAAADLCRVKPTKADARRNPDIDVMALWHDDIEHTIRCKGLDESMAAEFRAAVTQ